MMNRRVVVTGMGVVAPSGIGKDQLWERVRTGESDIEQVSQFNVSAFPTTIAAEVRDFKPEEFMERRVVRRMARSTQFAVSAARLAWDDARLQENSLNLDNIGVMEGTSLGPINSMFESHKLFLSEGCRKVNPTSLISSINGAGSGAIAIQFKLHGPCMTISDGSASSTFAIGQGYRYIKNGLLDLALVGGSEAPLSAEIFATFSCARLLSTHNHEAHRAMKPFDRDRDGFVLGEGGVFFVLEELSHALSRGADIYAEISGFGETTDAYHPTSPNPDGRCIAQAMTMALREANVSTSELHYLNAHGTATTANDAVETTAIKRCFGERAFTLPVSSTKPITGHLLGACGALEVAISIMAIRHQYLPPTINLHIPDDHCDLDYIPSVGRTAVIENVLTNNYSFSGRNASLVLKKFHQDKHHNHS